jgi:hypothetical protein
MRPRQLQPDGSIGLPKCLIIETVNRRESLTSWIAQGKKAKSLPRVSAPIGGLEFGTVHARRPEELIYRLQVGKHHGARLRVESFVVACRAGKVPSVDQQVAEHESRAVHSRHLVPEELDDVIHCFWGSECGETGR